MNNPDGYTALDLVGYTDQGDYNATKSYVANDLVHYGGSIWCCLIDDTVGITPTEGVNWRFWVENSQNGISDIVNVLGAKNLLKIDATSRTISGVTFTVNADSDGNAESITVNGTATEYASLVLSTQNFGSERFATYGNTNNSDYIISGLPQNYDFYLAYSPTSSNTTINVKSGITVDNVTVYPMIRPKNIEDDTWQPYIKTNKELTEDVNNLSPIKSDFLSLGVVNQIPYPYLDATKTMGGLTFTVNEDKSITVNGTGADYYKNFYLARSVNLLEPGDYAVSCGVDIPTESKLRLQIGYEEGNSDASKKECTIKDEVLFTVPSNWIDKDIFIRLTQPSAATIDNITVYPSIRKLTDGKTNRQLTDDVAQNTSDIQTLTNSIAPIENGTNYSQSYSKDQLFYHNGSLCYVTASSVNSSIAINIGESGNAKYCTLEWYLSNIELGVRLEHTWQASELANVSSGSIQVINRDGICCVKCVNLVCTAETPLLYIGDYVGNVYEYDIDNSGLYIDNGNLYSKNANVGMRILTFVR